MINALIIWGTCAIAMAITHELGHYLTIRRFGIPTNKIKIEMFKGALFSISYPDILCKEKKKLILFIGIISGLLPLLFFNFNGWGILSLLAVYSCFITRDIKRLKELGVKLKWQDFKMKE